MSSRLFIGSSPSFSSLEAFVAELVLPENSSGPRLQTLTAKCRELTRAESAVIVCPTPHSSTSFGAQLSLWMVAKKDTMKDPRITDRLQQLGIRVCFKIQVSVKVVQSCYQFTIIARLAPKWNQITEWIVKGSDFLTTSKAQAIKFDVGVTDTEVTLNVIVSKLVFHPLKPEDLNPPNTVLQLHRSNHDYIIQETSIYNKRCILLPNLSSGFIYSASHQLPPSNDRNNPFPNYNQIRLHWKKQYGILLPEEQQLFYQVFFNMNPTRFFLYPGCCVLKTTPNSYPSREADAVTAAFIADIHSRVPALCGQPIKYSSKAFTPTVGLQSATAIGAETTSRVDNLKPRSLAELPTPKVNLRYYPTTPHATLSSQPTHRAHVPSHSASLGGQPYTTAQQQIMSNCQPAHLSSGVPYIVNRSSNPGQAHTDVVHGAQYSNLVRPIIPGNAQFCVPVGGRSELNHYAPRFHAVAGMTTNFVLPKVVPQFGRRVPASQQVQATGSSVQPSTETATGRDKVFIDHTGSQPPKKRSKPNFMPASEPVIVSPDDTTTLPQPESAAMPKTSASMSSRQQEGKGAEDQLAVGDTPPGDKSAAALTEPSSQHRKETVSVNDTTEHRISVCTNAVLKKWLVENGVKCRARERKEVLIRLVTQHLQQTGKTFNL